MVNIRSIISREKERFKNFKTTVQKNRIEAETKRLEQERIRQADLAKVNAKKQNVQRELQKLDSYNKKVAGPSKLQKFSKGLTKTINEAKKSGHFKGIDFEGKRPGLSLGARDPFAKEKPKEKPKNKDIKIIIKQ